ncbi:hypothetical protein PRUPE_4G020500, partial [Prunus persica]
NFDSCIPSQILVFNFLFFFRQASLALTLTRTLTLTPHSINPISFSLSTLDPPPPSSLSQSYSEPLLSRISLPLWVLIEVRTKPLKIDHNSIKACLQ